MSEKELVFLDVFSDIMDDVSLDWLMLFDIDQLKSILSKIPLESTIPRPPKLFEAFKLFVPNDLKIVILGKEPTKKECEGFAYSTIEESPSNIVNCLIHRNLLTDNTKNKYANIQDFRYWATQGVLLLNMSLTNCHQNLWHPWIMKLLKKINTADIFAWGHEYQKIAKTAGFTKIYSHCSHLSAKFISCNHFDNYINSIDWNYNITVHLYIYRGYVAIYRSEKVQPMFIDTIRFLHIPTKIIPIESLYDFMKYYHGTTYIYIPYTSSEEFGNYNYSNLEFPVIGNLTTSSQILRYDIKNIPRLFPDHVVLREPLIKTTIEDAKDK